jgi:serine/threonine protein kinase
VATTRGQHLLGKEIGSCVLERLLGYGGSSAVFLARSLTSGDEVAVKVFLPRSTLDGAMRKSFYQRFLREAEAASHVEHPHILSIYAYGEHEGLPYIVMPYMPGGTLSEYVQQHGPLSLDEARRYLTQIASALDYAHTEGYVHCDVKPANILLDGQGHAALSDFGIVRWQQAEQPEEDGAKRSGAETLMGTPDYVSPEQALGEALDGRSDIYSLGATLYALLTGAPPFKADTPIALALMHVHEAPTPVGLLRADVTPQIDFVVAKALAKWPEERFQTAGAFALAFGLAVSEAGESAQFSLKHARLAKLEVANPRTPVPLTVLTAGAEPVVQIKPSPRLSSVSISGGAVCCSPLSRCFCWPVC